MEGNKMKIEVLYKPDPETTVKDFGTVLDELAEQLSLALYYNTKLILDLGNITGHPLMTVASALRRLASGWSEENSTILSMLDFTEDSPARAIEEIRASLSASVVHPRPSEESRKIKERLLAHS